MECFNGATLFQTWKYATALRKSTKTYRLQWSHAFSNVEINRFDRNRSDENSFNGATLFQTWKYNLN